MLRRPLLAFGPLVTSLALLGACNAITGVNDLPDPGGSGGGATTPPPLDPLVSASGVTIEQIAIYQGVKRSLMGGDPSPSGITVPIVAGRDALMRVFVKTDASYDKTPVTARLTLGDAPPIDVVGTLADADEASLGSTVNFEIPGEKMVVGLKYRVELTQPFSHTKGGNPGATYPATGSEAIDVQSDGMQLKLVIVPIKYGADGSNRLPDTSDTQIEGYKNAFYGTYPIRAIDVQVHAPMQWKYPISPDGSGWSEILDALASYRQQQGAAPDEYYFGAFEPDPTFDQYCAAGCVAGLGMVGEANDTYSRAAVGIGYPGNDAFTTAIHEVGHTQGRNHSPCGGAQGVDPQFPYKNAGIGAWGYDLINKQLVPPTVGKDLMGYCDPYWVSDYTYKAFFDRIKLVNKADVIVPDALKNLTWERARVDGQGKLSWLSPVRMALPPSGRATPVTVEGAGFATVVGGQFLPYDHLLGGVLLWPKASTPISRVQVTLDGKLSHLNR